MPHHHITCMRKGPPPLLNFQSYIQSSTCGVSPSILNIRMLPTYLISEVTYNWFLKFSQGTILLKITEKYTSIKNHNTWLLLVFVPELETNHFHSCVSWQIGNGSPQLDVVLRLCDVTPFGCCFYNHQRGKQRCWPQSSQKRAAPGIHEPNNESNLTFVNFIKMWSMKLQDKIIKFFPWTKKIWACSWRWIYSNYHSCDWEFEIDDVLTYVPADRHLRGEWQHQHEWY